MPPATSSGRLTLRGSEQEQDAGHRRTGGERAGERRRQRAEGEPDEAVADPQVRAGVEDDRKVRADRGAHDPDLGDQDEIHHEVDEQGGDCDRDPPARFAEIVRREREQRREARDEREDRERPQDVDRFVVLLAQDDVDDRLRPDERAGPRTRSGTAGDSGGPWRRRRRRAPRRRATSVARSRWRTRGRRMRGRRRAGTAPGRGRRPPPRARRRSPASRRTGARSTRGRRRRARRRTVRSAGRGHRPSR